MATSALPHSILNVSGTSSAAASDLLRSSSNGFLGVPLKTLGRSRLSVVSKRDLTVSAYRRQKQKKWVPYDKNNTKTHFSTFKPLKEKPKPIPLDFEKPLLDLEKKINDVRKMAEDTGLDFSDQLTSLQNKYDKALKDLYTHLTPIQRVNIARHPNRPTCLDHIFNITDAFIELHGDRAGYDDPAIVTGLGSIDGRTYMFIGHQKGRNTKENIKRNFGMPTPHGYRKALRLMNYADHHGFPIITFIDTPGAFADLKSEELNQGGAIAYNLRAMFGLKVPIVCVVIGEGGSGGALAIGCGNKLLMLENAVFYVASPEACAAILWKSAKAAPKAAAKLKITAGELYKLKICDGVIPEPLGGAHADPDWTSQQIKIAVTEAMEELMEMDVPELLKHRYLKFRNIGGFQEGVPVDPKYKFNMKKRGKLVDIKPKEKPLDLEKLRQQILEAKQSSSKLPEFDINEMIQKLRKEVDQEYAKAIKALGFTDRLEMLQEEFAKASNSSEQAIDPSLWEKKKKLEHEIMLGLSEAPNYESLKYKVDMLNEISELKKVNMKQEGKPIVQKEDAKYDESAQAMEYSGGDGSILKEAKYDESSVLKEDAKYDESVLKEDAKYDESSGGIDVDAPHS